MIPLIKSRMKAFQALLVTLTLMLMPGAASAISDLERTWVHARVAAPTLEGKKTKYFHMTTKEGKKFFDNFDGNPLPVVLYLHGCTGFSGDDRKVVRKIAAAGYMVVAPDSMARHFRPRQCSSRAKSGGAYPYVFDFRQAEISYALDNLWQKPWADWDNLFLVGVSEGGLAVAHYRGDYFKARVITQWTCNGAPLVRGISAPEDTPILAIVQKNDPWYNQEGGAQAGDCGAYFGDRPGSASVIIDGKKEHWVMEDDGVMDRIIEFLDQNHSLTD